VNRIGDGANTTKAQYFFFANGNNVGSFGQLQAGGAFQANFDVNYTPISTSYPSDSPAQVVTQAGDTLRIISARVFGDASLWYLIANENGLTDPDGALTAGTTLRVPNNVTSLHNDANSFKPFNASQAIGDTTPTQPIPPPQQQDGCGLFGKILELVVAVVVSYFAGPVIGNIAEQLVAMADGDQKGFNWKSLGVAAITEGVQFFGPAVNFGSGVAAQIASSAANAAIDNIAVQGIAVATGLQHSFSWTEVAQSAAAAPVTGIVGHYVGQGTGSSFVGDFVGHAAGGVVQQAIGGKIQPIAVAVDAFGNSLGDSLVQGILGLEMPPTTYPTLPAFDSRPNVNTYDGAVGDSSLGRLTLEDLNNPDTASGAPIDPQTGAPFEPALQDIPVSLGAFHPDFSIPGPTTRDVTPAVIQANQVSMGRIDSLGLTPFADPNDPHTYYFTQVFDGTWNNRLDTLNETNPALFFDDLLPETDHANANYASGVGTGPEGELAGGAYGAGAKDREKIALNQLGKAMSAIYAADSDAQIIVSSIGFSRGAAEARDFANLVYAGVPIPDSADPDTGQFQVFSGQQTPRFGALVLYDTVGSLGIAGTDFNPGYNLNIAPNVEHVLHITANDEDRLFFASSSATGSTDISSFSNGGRIVQLGIPGAHSDIGGGYQSNPYQYFALDMGYSFLHQLGVPLNPLTDPAGNYDLDVRNYSIESMQLHNSDYLLDKTLHAFGIHNNRTVFPARNPAPTYPNYSH
jgi:hypothetical protein